MNWCSLLAKQARLSTLMKFNPWNDVWRTCRCFRWRGFVTIGLLSSAFVGCERRPASPLLEATNDAAIRGAPIAAFAPTNTSVLTNAPFVPADYSKPDVVRDGVVQLGWEKLSGFKFDVYEVYSETNSGRALLRSDDSIPTPMRAYDGKRVAIHGYILPLRTRKGVVTEFLLLRDQGTCCFGAQAQINHFIRVTYPAGIKVGDPVPWTVLGILRVGESYVQGYLTGIYNLDAEEVRELENR